MEITQGNLSAVFTGLRATFVEALDRIALPEDVERLIQLVPSVTSSEEYPTALMLGDLEKVLDEVAYTNIAEFIQSVPNEDFARAFAIKRAKIEDDQIGMYTPSIQRLARLAATHPHRRIPYLFVSSNGTATGGAGGGFQTNWIDGTTVFSNTHAWPGGQAWDNLDALPLTATNFGIVCQHLRQRLGPGGMSLGLRPTLLIVGPANEVNAKRILERTFVGGGNSNIWHNYVKLAVWDEISDLSWFVVDDSDVKPVALQNRTGPDWIAQDKLEDDSHFNRHEFRYQACRRYGIAVVCPWLIQTVNWNEDSTTTTEA